MKKILLLSLTVILASSLFAQQKQLVEFNEKTHDFGVVKEEQNRITTEFTFVNTSTTPITLKNVRASCGCTAPKWQKEPVLPGESGTITVTYTTTGRPGNFQKSVSVVLSNGTEDFSEVLYIKGEVTPKAQPQGEAVAPVQAK